jgi:hypothetical protein
MQHKAVYLLFCKFTIHVSGVNHTHHQEYTKLLTTASGTGNIFFLCSYLPPWPGLATEGGSCTRRILPVPEAVVTVLFTVDGCG